MPQLVKKRRSGWAVLAVGALVASLLAVGAAPAGAAEIETGEENKAEPSEEATFSACVGDATEDYGFTDTDGLGAEADINCLAYYGITVGKTADTFDPGSNVTRSQMALFLHRAANVADVDLTGGDMDADFGDIADLGEDRQQAIKALASNGILAGRGDMTFDPHSDITRAEMAVALVSLVRHTDPDLFNQAGAAKGSLIIDASDLDYFADARAAVPVAVDTAISYAYELGITTGYPDATFRPNASVPRRNMASFITRALAHSTTTRPAGLSVQSDNGTLHVSMRDADFRPVVNETVDAFYVRDAQIARAFDADGECRSVVNSVDRGSRCKIDSLDPSTDADGETQLESLDGKIGEGITVWVWTGDLGDSVVDGTDLVEFAQGPVTLPRPADRAVISPSQAMTPKAHFGSSMQFTVQLRYNDDRGTDSGVTPEADDVVRDTPVGTDGEDGAAYTLKVAVYSGAATGVSYVSDVLTVAGVGGLVSQGASETLKTDSSGAVTFSLTTTDPDPVALDDERTVVYELTYGKNAPLPPAATEHSVAGFVVFEEDAPTVTVVKTTAINGYDEAPSEGGESVNGVVVSVLDQYHKPMRGQAVLLTSSQDTGDTASDLPTVARLTASSGNVRITYTYKQHDPGTETITATAGGVIGTADIVWMTIEGSGSSAAGEELEIVAGSVDDDEIVVDTDVATDAEAPALLRYDDNDLFLLSSDYVDVEAFETALSKILDPDNPDPTTQDGTLQWSSYDHDDSDDRTLFTLAFTAPS